MYLDTRDHRYGFERLFDVDYVGIGMKGHVPEENLARYRRIRELSHLMSSMGSMVSGMGEYDDANKLWAMAGKYTRMANELRVDVPPKQGA